MLFSVSVFVLLLISLQDLTATQALLFDELGGGQTRKCTTIYISHICVSDHVNLLIYNVDHGHCVRLMC